MTKYLFRTILGLAITAFSISTPTANAFTLRNYQTGLCLGVAAGNPKPGTGLVTWTCDGTPSQQWAQINFRLVYGYTDSYRSYYANVYSTSFSEEQGFTLSNGLATVGYDGYALLADNSVVQVVNGSSGVIGVKGAVMSNGTGLILYTWYGVPDQQWGVVFVGKNFDGNPCYTFENYDSSPYTQPYVMGVLGGNPKRGTSAVIWQLFTDAYGNPDYFGHPDQYWCVY